jgi:predicted Zn-dependent protease
MKYLEAMAKQVAAAPGVAAWHICERVQTSHQRYRIFKGVESERQATTRSVQITVHTEGKKDGNPVLGEAAFTLTGDCNEIPKRQLADAVARAALVANPRYDLPGPETIPNIPLDDPAVTADPWGVIAELTESMDRGAKAQKGKEQPICASEFFADRQTITVANSAGFRGQYSGTELFTEFVLLTEDSRQSVECYGMRRARRLDELDLEATIRRYTGWTADRLMADLPTTATLPVVFGEEALDTLMNTFAAHAGAKARFENWSRLDEGKPLIDNTKGDQLSITVDPTLPWRLSSRPFDAEGLINRVVPIVSDGRFTQRSANKRYADYLGVPATGNGGSLVVKSGTTPLATLLEGGPVLHALRFSTFHPNAVTGAFSGELRTAYLLDANGNSTPVCGGSVSGNVWEAFRQARLSAERTVRSGYDGPAGIRLEGVTVAGRQ